MSLDIGPTNPLLRSHLDQNLKPVVRQVTSNPDVFSIVFKSSTEDFTLLHSQEAAWSIDNLPYNIYFIQPLDLYDPASLPIAKTPFMIHGKYVNDLLILPWRISSRVEGWRLEAWCRHDRRITAQDIIDRVHPDFRCNISPTIIHERRRFFRKHFNVMAWDPSAEDRDSIENNIRIHDLIKPLGIDILMNSTRGLTPGLISPQLGEAGGRIPLPPKETLRYTENPDFLAFSPYGALPRGTNGTYFYNLADVRFIGDMDGNWWWQYFGYDLSLQPWNTGAILPVRTPHVNENTQQCLCPVVSFSRLACL